MVRSSSTTNMNVIFITFIWIEFPVFDFANTNCIDVRIHCDKVFTVTDIT